MTIYAGQSNIEEYFIERKLFTCPYVLTVEEAKPFIKIAGGVRSPHLTYLSLNASTHAI